MSGHLLIYKDIKIAATQQNCYIIKDQVLTPFSFPRLFVDLMEITTFFLNYSEFNPHRGYLSLTYQVFPEDLTAVLCFDSVSDNEKDGLRGDKQNCEEHKKL